MSESVESVVAMPRFDDGVPDPPLPRTGQRKAIGVGAWVAIAWLVGLTLAAFLAKSLPVAPPNKQFLDAAREGPSGTHWFGVDSTGRDVFGQSLHGARASLLVGFLAVTMGMVIGGALGMAAGYLGGWVDRVLSVLFDTFLAIPGLVLALALVVTLDPSKSDGATPAGGDAAQLNRLLIVAVALGIVSIPILGRIARASTLTVADRDFILAARAMGAKPARIVIRDVLPNVLPAMLSIGLLGMGIAIVAEGGLALLGASISSPMVSWGSAIASNRDAIDHKQWWMVFGPSAFLFVTVVALNYLGDVVRKRFDIRESLL